MQSASKISVCIASFVLLLLSFTITASAQEHSFDSQLQAAASRELPVADFASYLLTAAEAGELSSAQVERALSEVPETRQQLIEPAMTRLLEELSSGSTKKAQSLRVFAKKVFENDPARMTRVDRFFDLAEQADKLIEAGKTKEVLDLLQKIDNPTERSLLTARVSKAVNLLERQLLSSPDSFQALKELASFQKNIPNERAASITEALIKRIWETESSERRPSDQWTLDDPSVAGLLKASSQIRASLKGLVSDLQERRLHFLIESDDAEPLMRSYAGLLENRPDPNEKNDELRYWIVLNADGDEARQFALGRLEELKYSGSLSKLQQLRVMVRGYYGRGASVFLISSVIIVLICAALMAVKPFFIQGVSEAIAQAEVRSRQRAERAAAASAAAHTSVHARTQKIIRPPILKKDKYVPGYARGPIEKDEYTKLLEYLDLEDDASETEIKRAYRDRVKSLHPDAKHGEVNTQDEAFIELKEVYDRILEIRGSWFGGKR